MKRSEKRGPQQQPSTPGTSSCLRQLVGAAWFALGAGAAFAAPGGDPNAAQPFAKGRILVMPRAGLSDADFGRILTPHGGKARRIGKSRLYIVDLPAGASEAAVAERLARHPQLKFAEVDRRLTITFAPNDPYMGSEWHTTKIGAPAAWDLSQGAGVTIAILDTGVDGTHPDLAARMVPGWNFYSNSADTTDVQGHGTAVAGSAAATTNNALGIAGIAGSAKIMPIRVTDANGSAYASTIAQGITYAADHGARVANVSIDGVAASSTTISAAQYMKSKGGLVVVAAGNAGVNANIAATTSMIPVSATDSNDALTSWSSYGSYVALAAPGLNIWTTQRGGAYWSCWGTSFSSPITAGVVALMMAAQPSLPSTQIESLLYSTAVDLGAPGRDISFGYGRINAAAAVQAAAGAVSNVDTQPPTAAIGAPLAGSVVSGLVPVNVTASDNVGVTKVDLKVNGTTVATDTTAPYAFSWNSVALPNGQASLTAVAYDAAGNSAASAAITVSISNASTLAVAITKPANGSTVSGTVGVTASASTSGGTTGIKQSLYIDGALKATSSGGSLDYNWNTRKVANGRHTLSVVATDSAGNSSTNSVSVTK
jgi:subtilisin family serine protease